MNKQYCGGGVIFVSLLFCSSFFALLHCYVRWKCSLNFELKGKSAEGVKKLPIPWKAFDCSMIRYLFQHIHASCWWDPFPSMNTTIHEDGLLIWWSLLWLDLLYKTWNIIYHYKDSYPSFLSKSSVIWLNPKHLHLTAGARGQSWLWWISTGKL